MHPETEHTLIATTSGGLKRRGGGAISAITLDGTGSIVIFDNTSASGTILWSLRSASGDSVSVSFPKPIPFATGLYFDLTPSGGNTRVLVATD